MRQTISTRHHHFHRELRESLMRPIFAVGLIIGCVFLAAGFLGLVQTAIFPWDALSIAGLSIIALLLQHFGYISQANSWFIVGFMWAITFNMPFFGVNHPITALNLPVIVVSGLLIGRIFQSMMVFLSSMFIPIFALLEYAGRRQPAVSITVGDEIELIGSVLFWVGLMILMGWLVRTFAAHLEHAVAISRGQTLALAQTADLIKADMDIDTMLEQVVKTTAEQLQTDNATLFLYNEADDTVIAQIFYVHGQIYQREAMHNPSPIFPSNELPLWREVQVSKQPIRITDVANDPRLRYRNRLLSQEIRTILNVPLLLEDQVIGVLTLNSQERRPYLPEELELAQALVAQIALAMQLSRLSQANRETAVIRERNRMAREIHDTLAQGLTGVIVQLESAEDVLMDDSDSATLHLHQARQLARESLNEARRSVMALRPQSLDTHTLPAVIQHLIESLTTPNSPRITFQQMGPYQPIMSSHTHHLLRIVQETLTNALKYASASEINVQLCYDTDMLAIQVKDDGCGFSPNQIQSGFGLIGIRERADLIGATLSIDSEPERGTQITVEVSYV